MREDESISQALARPAVAFCFGDYELAQRIYDYVYNGWFMYASPVLSNAPKGRWIKDWEKDGAHYWYDHLFIAEEKRRGLPISCFAFDVPDTAKGQVEILQELAVLSMSGGGTGAHNSVRGVSKKAPGPIPYMKVLDGAIGYFKQNLSRKGALAYYMDVDHPDIREHIRFRVPGGDPKRRSDNRTQFHSAVNLTDDFIKAVFEDGKIDLKCPHSGRVYETMSARGIWEDMLDTRALTGEPYMMKIDLANRRMPATQKALGLKVKGSNLCVAPETKILTDKGHVQISTLEGQEVNVWNGQEFSKVTVHKTGGNQPLVRVVTDSGQELECTPYHKVPIIVGSNGKVELRDAKDLVPGDRLEKCEFPIIEGELPLTYAYENGFYSGDGCEVHPQSGRVEHRVYLYGEKRDLYPYFRDVTRVSIQENQNRIYFDIEGLSSKFFVPDSSTTISDRLSWFEGLCDADGTVARCVGPWGESQSIQVSSTNKAFLQKVQLMLQTLGVSTKVTFNREAGTYQLPANDGSGELKDYECQEVNRLLLAGGELYKLQQLGFSPKRLRLSADKPQRGALRFPRILEVRQEDRVADTFCFTEPIRHRGVFNGLHTGQCSEILLPTDEYRTFVCCLSSLNLAKYEEWKDTPIVEDLIRFLDNVLEYFIRNAPDTLSKAKFSAERERALGLGTFGWHSLLQSRMIPFESGGFNSAIQLSHEVYGLVKSRATASSQQLARERGEAPDMVGTGLRNSRLMAIAPNANSADLANSSPSIEPWYRNCFLKDSRAGSFFIKNPYLEALLESKGLNTRATWNSIQENQGSVQHLDFLDENEKAVFKTAMEIDQHWIVELADQRGQYICQAQSLNLFFPAGVSKEYVNSVHLKFLRSENVVTLYYFRTERESKVDTVKQIERKALVDWKGEECVACQG